MDTLAFEMHGIKFKYDYSIRDNQGGLALVADWGTHRYKVAEAYLVDQSIYLYDELGTLKDDLLWTDKEEALRWLKVQAAGFAVAALEAPELMSNYKQIK